MRPNYESVFDACIKLSGKWISLANSVSYVAIINTLWNILFLLLDYPDLIAFEALSYRLFLISFGCVVIGVIFSLAAYFCMRKL
jgi:hypothetical protein